MCLGAPLYPGESDGMRRRLLLIMVALLATACAGRSTPTPTLVPTPTAPNIRVDVWVDNPTPALGSDVTVRFNLLNDGVPINGLVMSAMWQQGGRDQLCHSQVQFDMGMCAIHVSDMAPGVYVPVTVTTTYIGWTFFGYTGFTPR